MAVLIADSFHLDGRLVLSITGVHLGVEVEQYLHRMRVALLGGNVERSVAVP